MGSIKILTVGVLCSVAAVFAAGCSGEKKTPEEISVEAVPVGRRYGCQKGCRARIRYDAQVGRGQGFVAPYDRCRVEGGSERPFFSVYI